MKHSLLFMFLNIAGLVQIDGRHHVHIVHDSWTNFFIQYNLADYCKVSKAKLKLVDNKQFIHWFLKIGENCKHEPMYQFKKVQKQEFFANHSQTKNHSTENLQIKQM